MISLIFQFIFDLFIHFIISFILTIGNISTFISSLYYNYFINKTIPSFSSSSSSSSSFKKYVVVITGCDSGFGKLISIKLNLLGFHVISGCITNEGVESLKDIVSISLICDVTKENDINNLFKQTELYLEKNQLKLWAVINNAGIGNSGSFDWIPLETIRKVMEVNFFGVVAVTKAFLPLLKKTKNSRIVNLSSVAGFSSAPMMGAYAASKHAVEGMFKSVREELKPWNIHVVNINPGFFKTPIVTSNTAETLKTFNSIPEEIKSQYTSDLFVPNEAMLSLLEDPNLVVETIVEALTKEYVPMWLFPGIQANYFARHNTSVTNGMMELLSLALPASLYPKPKKEVLKSLQGE